MQHTQRLSLQPLRVGWFRHLLQAVCLIVIIGVHNSKAQTSLKLTYPELFQRIWQTVKDQFYDPALLGVDWEAVRKRYQPKVEEIKDDAEFLSLMREMLREVPTSHLGFQPPATGVQTGIAVSTVTVNGRPVIASVDVCSDAQRQWLQLGRV